MQILLEYCYQLEGQGKKPSVAMLKKFAGTEHSLKVIIGAITKWNSLDEQQKEYYGSVTPIEHVTPLSQPSISLEERVLMLEKQVSLLQKEIKNLSS